MDSIPELVEKYLESINSDSNESLSVTENEAKKKSCKHPEESIIIDSVGHGYCGVCHKYI